MGYNDNLFSDSGLHEYLEERIDIIRHEGWQGSEGNSHISISDTDSSSNLLYCYGWPLCILRKYSGCD